MNFSPKLAFLALIGSLLLLVVIFLLQRALLIVGTHVLLARYIGNEYSLKSKHLAEMRSRLGHNFQIYGSYKLAGLPFILSNFSSFWRYPCLPKKISNYQRSLLYLSSTVGFNIHLSFPRRRECGNARTYELASHGVAQVVDHVGSSTNSIFSDSEVITYSSIPEAVEITKYLFQNPIKARDLGIASLNKFHSHYNPQLVYSRFITWLFNQKNSGSIVL